MSDYRKDTNKKREREKIFLYLCTRDINNIVYFCLNLFMSCTYMLHSRFHSADRNVCVLKINTNRNGKTDVKPNTI